MFLRVALFTLIAIGATAFGGIAWISLRAPATQAQAAEPGVAKTMILTAARPLRAGALLKPEDLAPTEIATTDVKPGSSPDTPQARSSLMGAMIRRSLTPGDVVLPGDVMRPGDHGFLAAVLGQGMRAVSVGVDAVSGTAGLIWPGDNVDLILTMDDTSNSPGRRVSGETVLHSVRVIAIDQTMVQGAGAGGPDAQTARTVTLEVKPAEAERVQVAVRLGKLSLVVVSADDSSVAQLPTAPLNAPIPTAPASTAPIWNAQAAPAAGTPAAAAFAAPLATQLATRAAAAPVGTLVPQPAPVAAAPGTAARDSVTWGGDVSAALRAGQGADSHAIRVFSGTADKEYRF